MWTGFEPHDASAKAPIKRRDEDRTEAYLQTLALSANGRCYLSTDKPRYGCLADIEQRGDGALRVTSSEPIQRFCLLM